VGRGTRRQRPRRRPRAPPVSPIPPRPGCGWALSPAEPASGGNFGKRPRNGVKRGEGGVRGHRRVPTSPPRGHLVVVGVVPDPDPGPEAALADDNRHHRLDVVALELAALDDPHPYLRDGGDAVAAGWDVTPGCHRAHGCHTWKSSFVPTGGLSGHWGGPSDTAGSGTHP